MTIREIEEKTGMTRANVRYYEREGLLSPVRGANNYRDYSEDDLAALKKIQLLRQLRVPVAEIVRLKSGLFVRWLRQAIITFFAGAAEALLLCTIGTTPGKWIFGLRVRQRDGGKLSFFQAGYRAAQRFVYGEGCLVPLVSLWRNWVSYKACVNGEVLPWDEGIAYSCTPHKRRPLLCFPMALLYIAGIFFISAQSILPVHQGLLTKEAFVENCETFARQHIDYYNNRYLDDDLIWRRMESSNTIIIDFSGESVLEDIPYELTLDADGHITAIHVEYESREDEGWIGDFSGTVSILHTAYVLASNRANAFSCLLGDDLWKGLDWMEDFTLTDGCVRVSHEIEYQGYEYLEAQGLLFRDDSRPSSEAPYFRWSLTLIRTENTL